MPLPAPGDWAEGSVEFTMPAEATFLRIMIHVNGPARLWVDDLALDERVDGAWRPLMQPGLPPEHDFVRQWVELFHGEGRPYLMLGRTIRPPRRIDSAPASPQPAPFAPVMLNAFRAPDGSEAAVVVNATDEEQNVRFRWHEETRTLELAPWTLRLVR